jgi:uncharacterized protein
MLVGTLVLIAVCVLLRLLVTALEPSLVFYPMAGEVANPSSEGIAYHRHELSTADGQRLVAWQLEPEDPIADVVYFHGNGGNLSAWLPMFAALTHSNLRVLAIDYRGYGLSTGRPSEQGLYQDAEAVVTHARSQRGASAPRPLVYWGRSLGGAVAAAAAHFAPPDGVILESTFADKAAVIRRNPILRALNLFSSYRFATVDALRDFSGPVLVMHGDHDSVIPFDLGRELFDRLHDPKRFAVIRGGDHNDAFPASDRAYWEPVLEFVAGLPKTSPSPH